MVIVRIHPQISLLFACLPQRLSRRTPLTIRENISPGEPVATFGYPLTQQLTMTTGVVSSVYRTGLSSDARPTLEFLLVRLSIPPGRWSVNAFMDRSPPGFGIDAARCAPGRLLISGGGRTSGCRTRTVEA